MPKEVLIAIAAGLLSAMLALSVTTGSTISVLFVYLAPLPLMIMGLGFGSLMATIGTASGVIAVFVGSGWFPALIFALINGLPAVLVAQLALRSRTDEDGSVVWFPPGPILASLAATAAVLFLAVAILSGGSEGGIAEVVRSRLSAGLTVMAPNLSATELKEVVDILTAAFPAATAISWLAMTVITAVLAQWVLVRSSRALRPSPRMADLDLPDWSSWALVGAGILALIGEGQLEYIGHNLVVILAVPFFFLGLGIVHALVGRAPFPGMMLVTFYMLLLMLSAWAALLVTGLGFIEQWACLRQRFAVADNGQEDE